MKLTFAYYLVIIYFIAVCKPSLPVIKDNLAHLFWETEHVSTVHHNHGSQHVHLEIIAAGNHKELPASQATKIIEPVSIHIVSEQNYNFTHTGITANTPFARLCLLPHPFAEINGPPPDDEA